VGSEGPSHLNGIQRQRRGFGHRHVRDRCPIDNDRTLPIATLGELHEREEAVAGRRRRHAAKGARHPEQRASLVERHRIEVDKPGRQSHVVGFTFVEIGGGELPLPAMSA
jgi:hypothetical protein